MKRWVPYWGHEMEAHLGHDAKVALGEDTVDGGTVGMLEGLSGRIVLALEYSLIHPRHQHIHARPQHLTTRQNHLPATVLRKVVPIGRIPHPPIHRIHQHTAPHPGRRRRWRGGGFWLAGLFWLPT